MLGIIVTAVLAIHFDVLAGDADAQIMAWSKQAHLQVLYDANAVAGLVTRPVKGELEPIEALRVMLAATGLLADLVNDHTVAIFESDNYCHPERGAMAPLPPCIQKPLTIPGEL